MVKYGCDLLAPGTLKSAMMLKSKWMSRADFLHAGGDVILFG